MLVGNAPVILGGVDIPDELLSAQGRGDVVFLCGAGVSQRVGLPSFRSLVTDVYGRLRETWRGHAAETDAMEPPSGASLALDRALFALAKRLGGHDPAARVRSERRILEAVTAQLEPTGLDLPDHRNIARLSRDAEMRSRIVTTNFDTLFERAWPTGAAPSRAGADLPGPQTADFEGVLHLHGRIADDALGLTRTPLVLNSAEFGEAYLRSGWAARYVYDLARATTIVIVGYGADDPPMRYILEVLTADRERYPDLRPIYAFAPSGATDEERARTRAVWEAKGATAITYDSARPDDHDALYVAIGLWADLADDPAGWRRAEAGRILAQNPDGATEGDWDRLRWILKAGGGAQLLSDVNPAARWAQPLAAAGLLADDAAPPAGWIHRRMSDPEMPAAILTNVPIDARTIAMIEHGLDWPNRDEAPLPPHLAKAWRLILAATDQRRQPRNSRWHAATRALGRGDASLPVRRDLVGCLRPTPHPEAPSRWPGLARDPEAPPRLRDVIGVRFDPSQLNRLGEIAASIPAGMRRATLRSLEAALQDGLEDAEEYESPREPDRDVRSVSRHEQDRFPSGFYPVVRVTVDLWELLAADDPERAVGIADGWRTSYYPLVRRMWLHALSSPAFDAAAVTQGITLITDDDFWRGSSRREVMRLLVERWDDLTPDARARTEARIIGGVPQDMTPLEGAELRDHVDHQILTRLERLTAAAKVISVEAQAALAAVKARHPQWTAGPGDRDDFSVWSSGLTMAAGRDGDPQLLAGVGPDLLVATAAAIAQRDRFRQGDVWRALCEADPYRALAALEAGVAAGRSEQHEWRQLFYAGAQSDDPNLHAALAVAALRGIPDGATHAVLDLLMLRRGTAGMSQARFLALWDRLFAELQRDARPVEDELIDDPVFRLLNDAEGKLATVLLQEVGRGRRSRERNAFPRQFRVRMERLIASEGALGHLGRAAAMESLAWFGATDPDWTLANLTPWLSWRDPVAATVCWKAAVRHNVPPARIHNAILPDLLDTVRRAELGRELRELPTWLLAPILWRQVRGAVGYAMTAQDVRQALARGGDGLRSSAAFWLLGALEELEGDPAARWRDRVGPLIADVWPQEPALRSAGVSQTLVRLPFLCGDAFPEAVDAIAPLVVPLEPWEAVMWLEFDDEGMHRFDEHPAAMLRLMEAIVDPAASPQELEPMLMRIAAAAPELEASAAFRKLLGWARARGG